MERELIIDRPGSKAARKVGFKSFHSLKLHHCIFKRTLQVPSCWTVKLRPDPSSNKQCMPLIIQLKWPSQVNKHQLSLFTKAAEPKPAKILRVPPQEEYVRRLS